MTDRSGWHKSSGWNRVDEAFAMEIADAYFLCDRDRRKMGAALGFGRSLDAEYLAHPLTRRAINQLVTQMRRDKLYSRAEHIEMLQSIRDKCIADDNWKTALAAETQVGRAAGLYDNVRDDEDDDRVKKVEDLSNDQIKARLAKLQGQSQLPAPANVIVQNPPQEHTPEIVDVDDGTPF